MNRYRQGEHICVLYETAEEQRSVAAAYLADGLAHVSWRPGDPPGAQQVVEYEALLNQLFRGVRACGMCQYDRRRLPDHALATHSSTVIEVVQPLDLPQELWELRQR